MLEPRVVARNEPGAYATITNVVRRILLSTEDDCVSNVDQAADIITNKLERKWGLGVFINWYGCTKVPSNITNNAALNEWLTKEFEKFVYQLGISAEYKQALQRLELQYDVEVSVEKKVLGIAAGVSLVCLVSLVIADAVKNDFELTKKILGIDSNYAGTYVLGGLVLGAALIALYFFYHARPDDPILFQFTDQDVDDSDDSLVNYT